MPVSRWVRDIICKARFKGFEFDSNNNELKALENLDNNDLSKIAGELNIDPHDSEFRQLVSNIAPMESFTVRNLVVGELSSGMILILKCRDNHEIEMLYLGEYRFVVLSDSIDCLKPMDAICSVSPHLEVGKDIYFQVIRDGHQYPDDSSLFHTVVECIMTKYNNSSFVSPITNTMILPSADSSCIYANKYHPNPRHFDSYDFSTMSDSSPFELNLDAMTFTLNRSWVERCFDESIVCGICDVTKTHQGFDTVIPGRLERYDKDGSVMLSIVTNANVTI